MKKKYFVVVFAVAVAMAAIAAGCSKNASTSPNEGFRETNSTGTSAYVQPLKGFQTGKTEKRVIVKDGAEYAYYYTPITGNGKLAAVKIGYITSGGKIFNVIYDESMRNTDPDRVMAYTEWGLNLGTATLVNERLVIQKTTGTSNTTDDIARSWWTCTTDCTGDAHAACYGGGTCSILLLLTNAGGGYVGAPGAGSISIFTACGIVCARNPNLDMLPLI